MPVPSAAAPATPSALAATTTGSAASTLNPPFARWIADFRASARAEGIDETTLAAAFDDVQYLPDVVDLDGAQPAFTHTVRKYLDIALSEQRVARGRDKLMLVRAEAEAASARHGIPAGILVAIWGLESNYGSNYGDTPVIDALATLGFEGRRTDWARRQLLAALKILQNGDVSRAQMIGSRAGAMGQTQFLPSSFLAYAVDADGDGRRDIWGSVADVMASTANFLAHAGWQILQDWGVEVRLPDGYDLGRLAIGLRQSSAQWADEGVLTMDGTPMPDVGASTILLPAGANGPAFLVGPNFQALLRYDNSTSYALAVGLLSQRLTGGPGVQASWPREPQELTRSQIVALQTALNRRGFSSGTADGKMGPMTRDAVRRYQRSIGLPADGYPDLDLLRRLEQP